MNIPFYNPSLETKLIIIDATICNTINAIIGEKSKPPIGGRIFLNGASNVSAKIVNNENGCFVLSIFGIHDNKQYIINNMNTMSKNELTNFANNAFLLYLKV